VAARVYGLALRILGDSHQSEVVTREVFLELWETSNRFDPARGSALSWVMALAHRRAVDRVRSTEAQGLRDLSDAERSLATPFDETAEVGQASFEASKVRNALTSLAPVQRQALELAYFSGHSHHEVSELLQIPLGTAKTRIRDGLIQLRDSVAPAVSEPA
jgi:RNA polymerase sigma-70 factor (ECF subfamily)